MQVFLRLSKGIGAACSGILEPANARVAYAAEKLRGLFYKSKDPGVSDSVEILFCILGRLRFAFGYRNSRALRCLLNIQDFQQ